MVVTPDPFREWAVATVPLSSFLLSYSAHSSSPTIFALTFTGRSFFRAYSSSSSETSDSSNSSDIFEPGTAFLFNSYIISRFMVDGRP